MKKTYEFKPLAILLIVFNVILLLGTIFIINISSEGFSQDYSLLIIDKFIVLFVGLVGLSATMVLLCIYYFKKEKALSIIFLAILNLILIGFIVFSLLNNAVFLGDESGLFFVVIVLGISNLSITTFMMLRIEKVVHWRKWDRYLPSGKEECEKRKERLVEREKKTLIKSKQKKYWVGTIALICLLFMGYKAWDRMNNKIEFDAFNHIGVSFDGYNTKGEVSISQPLEALDGMSQEAMAFINQLFFDYDMLGLSNGDVVTLRLSYSKEEAKRLNIVFKEESKDYIVSGLADKYNNASEIDAEQYKMAYDDFMEGMQNSVANSLTKVQFVTSYYMETQENLFRSNQIIFVVKITETKKEESTKKQHKSVLYKTWLVPFDSNYYQHRNVINPNEGSILFKINEVEYVEKDDEVYDSIIEKYTSMSKFIDEIEISVK